MLNNRLNFGAVTSLCSSNNGVDLALSKEDLVTFQSLLIPETNHVGLKYVTPALRPITIRKGANIHTEDTFHIVRRSGMPSYSTAPNRRELSLVRQLLHRTSFFGWNAAHNALIAQEELARSMGEKY